MSRSELPIQVQRFLKEQIRSIEQLEILLLLRDGAERVWTVSEVYNVVRSSERSVSDTLTVLHRQGLIRRTGEANPVYQFAPASEGAQQAITDLAGLYAEWRVRIVEAIYSERTSDVDEFARAFRLRKDDHHG